MELLRRIGGWAAVLATVLLLVSHFIPWMSDGSVSTGDGGTVSYDARTWDVMQSGGTNARTGEPNPDLSEPWLGEPCLLAGGCAGDDEPAGLLRARLGGPILALATLVVMVPVGLAAFRQDRPAAYVAWFGALLIVLQGALFMTGLQAFHDQPGAAFFGMDPGFTGWIAVPIAAFLAALGAGFAFFFTVDEDAYKLERPVHTFRPKRRERAAKEFRLKEGEEAEPPEPPN